MRTGKSFESDDGVTLNVDIAGEGPPVIFQHGLCGDARQTNEAFPSRGFRRITVEARGHGLSGVGALSRLSIATFADDVKSYIVKHLSPPVVIGGISMGAAIALRIATYHPELVKALILVRPAWITASAPGSMRPNAEVGGLLKEMSPERAKATFLLGNTARQLAKKAPDNLSSLTAFFMRQPVDVTAALLTRISGDGPGVSMKMISELSIPVLIAGHERDAIHPIKYATTLAKLISSARFVRITPKAESPSRYAADLRCEIAHFLQEL